MPYYLKKKLSFSLELRKTFNIICEKSYGEKGLNDCVTVAIENGMGLGEVRQMMITKKRGFLASATVIINKLYQI